MNAATFQRPALLKVVPDALAFVLGLGTAWLQGWTTTDLVWSLWLSSLVLGYLTILSTIAAGVYIAARLILQGDVPPQQRMTVILIGSVVALFFLGFFSLHFCGFHAAHAGFLTHFFPLEQLPKNAFNDAFMNPIRLWKTALQYLVPAYGVFLLPAIIAERGYVFASLISAARALRAGVGKTLLQGFMQRGQGGKKSLGDPFVRPYINVIRMHLLIFFFGLCHALKVESFYVFTTVYVVYFFPWRAFRNETAPAQVGAGVSAL